MMQGDPDREKSAPAIAQAEQIAHRQIRCLRRLRTTFAPGANEQEIELSAGIWQILFSGLVPCAFRIGQEVEDDWYAGERFEVFDPQVHGPIDRLINPGDVLRWRPIGAGPYRGCAIVLVQLSRTNTYGG